MLFAPDSEDQQAAVWAVAAVDGFNWGYDPVHFRCRYSHSMHNLP